MAVKMIGLPSYSDERGLLTVADEQPAFEIARAFWVTELDEWRGGHAHKTCEQVMVAVAGTLTVKVEEIVGDDEKSGVVLLNNPSQGLYIPAGVFVSYRGSPGAVALVLCSEPFDETDYIEKGESIP